MQLQLQQQVLMLRQELVLKKPVMETPKLRIPEIDEMMELGPAKATPALAVMGAVIMDCYRCASWSASLGENGNVRCVYFWGDKCGGSTHFSTISVRPALPESVVSEIRPNNMRAGKFFETSYEGIGCGKPVADDIANDILKNRDQLPKTGKIYPVYNQNQSAPALEFIPEILYKGKKYVVLTGHPANDNSQIDGVPVEKGKLYVFKIEKLCVDDKGHFEYPMIVSPIEPTGLRYCGNMNKTWMGRKVLPKLAKSLVPSYVDEAMIQRSYEVPKERILKERILKKIARHQSSIQKLKEELRQYQ